MADYGVLRNIGLSKTATACYEDLFQLGHGISATELAKRLHKRRSGLYRVLHELEAKGFVTSSKIAFYPFYFSAVPLDQALRNYSDYQWRLVDGLFEEQRKILAKRSGRPDHYRGRATF
jgi:sugar-specific transcriptional regulator TrmB